MGLPLLEEGVEDRAHGYGEEHAHKAEEGAAYGDQCEGVDGWQSEGSSDDAGVDEVAFKLLEDDEEDEEEDGLDGRGDGDDDGADDGARVGSIGAVGG